MKEVIQYSKEPLSAAVKPKKPRQLIALLFCVGQHDKFARLAISGRLANGHNMQAVQMCRQPDIGTYHR